MKLPSWLVSGALKIIDKAAHDPKVQAKALEVLRKVVGKKKAATVEAQPLNQGLSQGEQAKP